MKITANTTAINHLTNNVDSFFLPCRGELAGEFLIIVLLHNPSALEVTN